MQRRCLASLLRNADVAFVQGLWLEKEVRLLAESASGQLPYSFFFHTTSFGQILTLLSKYPISQATFSPFLCQGEPLPLVSRGFLAARGIGSALLDTPCGSLALLTTQLAPAALPAKRTGTGEQGAGAVPHDMHAGPRLAQIVQLAHAAEVAARRWDAIAVVVAGLFNCPPDSTEMVALLQLAPSLQDAWAAAGGSSGDQGATVRAGGARERRSYVLTTAQPTCAELLTPRALDSGTPLSKHAAVAATLRIPAGTLAHRAPLRGAVPADADTDVAEANGPGASSRKRDKADARVMKAGDADASTVEAHVQSSTGPTSGVGWQGMHPGLLQACQGVVERGHRRMERGALITNVLGTLMLVAGIVLVCVAGALPIIGWDISKGGYVVLETFGTLLIGVSTAVSFLSMFGYAIEAGNLQSSARELQLLAGPKRVPSTTQGANAGSLELAGPPRAHGPNVV